MHLILYYPRFLKQTSNTITDSDAKCNNLCLKMALRCGECNESTQSEELGRAGMVWTMHFLRSLWYAGLQNLVRDCEFLP